MRERCAQAITYLSVAESVCVHADRSDRQTRGGPVLGPGSTHPVVSHAPIGFWYTQAWRACGWGCAAASLSTSAGTPPVRSRCGQKRRRMCLLLRILHSTDTAHASGSRLWAVALARGTHPAWLCPCGIPRSELLPTFPRTLCR